MRNVRRLPVADVLAWAEEMCDEARENLVNDAADSMLYAQKKHAADAMGTGAWLELSGAVRACNLVILNFVYMASQDSIPRDVPHVTLEEVLDTAAMRVYGVKYDEAEQAAFKKVLEG